MAHYLISEASRRLHVEAHVLRYWEEELKLEIPRNELGHRYYTEKQIALFQRIKELKELGYQLKAIRTSLQDKQEPAQEAGFLLEEDREETTAAPFTVLRGQTEGTAGPEKAVSGERAESGQAGTEPEKDGCRENRELRDSDSVDLNSGSAAEQAGSDSGRGTAAEEAPAEAPAPGVSALAVHSSAGTSFSASPEKMEQFQNIMTDVVAEALRRSHAEFSREMGGEISEKVVKEMNYIMRDREEREEERYRKLDETIRACQRVQKQKSEAAATRVPVRGAGRRKLGWRKKKK